MALTGSNQTFAWKLSFTDQEKSRQIKVHFGPWDKQHDVIDAIRITYVREASGKETIKSTVKKFYWTGDLTLDYVAFTLFNAQRHDSGDYGIRIRVDEDHVPETEMSWFTLSVQDPPTLPPKAPGVCKSALGMQSKGIPNANISASSTLSTNHVPAFARLDERRGGWCSAPNDNSPYVEILLDEEKLITKVVTQGSYKDLLWATKYQIKYLKEGKWSSYQKADGSLKLEGNTNVRALKEHDLQPPIRTHSIRIYPMAPLSLMPNEYNVVCLRLELFGCSVKSCGDPGTPINGEQAHVKIGYIYGGSVEFTCKDNYTLSGASEIYCEETKNWSSPLPQCWAPCPDPRVPSNGRRIGDDFRHGKSVTFKCQDEFELKGVATINCNDGTWTDDIPQCKAPCPDPGVPSNGRRIGDDFRHGKSVTFKCQDEFDLKGMTTINCNDGTWTDDIPQCKAPCPDPGMPSNGRRIGDDFRHGKSVTFKCQDKFELKGVATINCNDGTWTDDIPQCKGPWYASCRDIFQSGKSQGNTAYMLQTDVGKVPVYCHMTSIGACGSGGWTLVMKIDGHKSTFHYNSDYWTNQAEYNRPGGKTGFDTGETKLPTYWSTPFSRICLAMKLGQQIRSIVINKQANSLYSLIADGQYRATSLGRNTWKSLIGSQASLQRYCNREGFNVVSTSKARIGIVANQQNNCVSCNSRIGFGTGGYFDDSNTCGIDACCSADNGNKYIKAMGYILVQ
ncbi:hypothetical protein ACROYT_G029283 [Oculina patagonica]